jgi:hypothetical protein
MINIFPDPAKLPHFEHVNDTRTSGSSGELCQRVVRRESQKPQTNSSHLGRAHEEQQGWVDQMGGSSAFLHGTQVIFIIIILTQAIFI